MATDRKASAQWNGDLMSGNGTVRLDSSTAVSGDLKVSWPARTEDGPGEQTSPEELIAAAHASCFSMALSNVLAKGGNTAEQLNTSATVTFSTEGGAHIEAIALTVEGRVPGISAEDFDKAADTAKENCPVSKALNVPITLEASLAS